MKHRALLKIIIVVLSIVLCLSTASAFFNYLPGFEGRVLDKGSRKPIKNAYVICFTDFQPFYAHSHYPDTFEISITDQNGQFKIKPYVKLSFGSIDTRKIFIVSEDYLYPLRFYQELDRKNFIRVSSITYRPSEEYDINSNLELFLDNRQEIKEIEGSIDTVTSYWELLGEVAYRYDDFKSDRIRKFEKYLLHLLVKKKNDVKGTLNKPEHKQQWETDLNEFKDKIERSNKVLN